MGSLLKIYLRPARGELRDVTTAVAGAGNGLEGDHAKGPKRQVTLLSREAWEATCAQLGQTLDPGVRRANLLVEGVELKETQGQTITVGDVRIRLTGETDPCTQMDDAVPGLLKALVPDWRGGVFGEVLNDGTLTVGDAVTLEPGA
jgi:MOSC domain-containing protein YiiM